ncbi:MAG TPA: M1 family peptidase, partial [Vicinamibacteria bacterium]|nr:M1 family peptidase [Vicinamibacteria bacterium]
MRRAAALVLATAVASGSAWADTYPRQPGVDVLHYAFRLTLADDSDAIEGEAAVGFRVLEGGVSEMALDLVQPSPAPGGRGMTVEGVTEAGAPLRFEHAQDRIRIHLARPGTRGEPREIVVRYHGSPASGLLIAPNKHGDRTFFSDNWPDKARQWLPVVDHPYDKATSEFRVTAPAHYQVVGNGLLVEETDLGDGRRLSRWRQ